MLRHDFWKLLVGNSAACAMLCLFYIWHLVAPQSLAYHCREDRIVEYSTAVFFLLASFAMIAFVVRQKKMRATAIQMTFPICWALLFFIFAGEEISWGQRLIGLETPEALASVNKQNELNIHNIEWVDEFLGGKYRWMSVLVLTTGVLMPIATTLGRVRRLCDRFALPVVQLHYAAFFLGGYMFCKILGPEEVGRAAQEIREFMFSLGYLLFAVHWAAFPGYYPRTPCVGDEVPSGAQ